MIDGKILKFGYGDIAISARGLCMEFLPFKPPVKIGTCCRELFYNKSIKPIGKTIYIKFDNFEDLAELKNKLEGIRPKNAPKVFEFKGYTFDFSNYNAKSVEVFEMVRYHIHMTFLGCAAC